jgi:hypothetical protein
MFDISYDRYNKSQLEEEIGFHPIKKGSDHKKIGSFTGSFGLRFIVPDGPFLTASPGLIGIS